MVLLPTTAGHLTKYALDTYEIPYTGSALGFSSILNTPPSEIEMITPSYLRAYGWCYKVDGKLGETTPDQFKIDPMSDYKLTWYYGYADKVDNKWVNYCVPVSKISNPFICR